MTCEYVRVKLDNNNSGRFQTTKIDFVGQLARFLLYKVHHPDSMYQFCEKNELN
jgi:hypothetical protein